MRQVFSLEHIVLEIAHHGVQLRHGVRNRRAGRKYDTLVAGDLINVPAFQEHIRRLLRVGSREAGNVAHFCVEKQVFERMGFIHIEPVYAKLLEGDDIILAAGVLQFLELHFEALFGLLQTLDGETLGIICL